MNYSRIAQLVKAARLYYESGYDQSEIAKELSVSRSYVSKLLAEAKEQQIVTFRIHDPMDTESDLERTIRTAFNLRKVIVASAPLESNAASSVAQKAAQWLSQTVRSGDVIGMGWGRTLYLMSKYLPRRSDISGVEVVSLYGQQHKMRQNVFNTESLTYMAEAFNATTYLLTSPVSFSNVKLKNEFLREQSMISVMDCLRRANIVVFTIGSIKRSSYLDQPGMLTDEELRQAYANDGIGDVCLHIIDRNGSICLPEFDERLVSIPLDILRQKDYRIAVAAGRYKTEAVYSALKGGIMNVLIIDEDIARDIVERINAKKRR